MKNDDLENLLSKLSKEDYCYPTTKGRKSGLPREIEIWFGKVTRAPPPPTLARRSR